MSVSPFEFPRLTGTDFTPEQALRTPIGALSPLWFAYAGAASAGAAYWWMTRWMRPFNIEAQSAPIEAATAVVEDLVEPVLAASQAMAVELAEIEPVAEFQAGLAESPAVEAAPHIEVAHTPETDTDVALEAEAEPTEPKAKTRAAARKPATPAAVAAPTTRSAASRRPPRKTAPTSEG